MTLSLNTIGILISYASIAVILIAAQILLSQGIPASLTRILVHIAACNWWFIARFFIDSPIAAGVLPASIVILMSVSYKFNLIRSIEAPEKRKNLDIIYYPISIGILSISSYTGLIPIAAASIGIFSLGFASGISMLIEDHLPVRRKGILSFFNRSFLATSGKRTLGGTLAIFLLSGIIAAIVLKLESPLRWQYILIISLLIAATATMAKLGTTHNLTNISIPISTAAVSWGLLRVYLPLNEQNIPHTMSIHPALFATIVISAGVLALLLWKLKGTSRRGSLMASFSFVLLAFTAGWKPTLLIAATLSIKAILPGSKRNATRVAATSLPAMLLAFLYSFNANPLLLWAIAATAAAILADAAAGAAGRTISPHAYNILTLRQMPAGLSGGVSLPGIAVAALAALAIGAGAIVLLPSPSTHLFTITALCGFLSSILNSMLGASVQAVYRDIESGKKTNDPGSHNPKIRGLRFVGPACVDFISVGAAAGAALLLVSR